MLPSPPLPSPCTHFLLVTELRTETQSFICAAAPPGCSQRCLRGDGHVTGVNKPLQGTGTAHCSADRTEENRYERGTHRNSVWLARWVHVLNAGKGGAEVQQAMF